MRVQGGADPLRHAVLGPVAPPGSAPVGSQHELRTTEPDGAWRVDGKGGSPAVQPAAGDDDTVDATLTLSDANLAALVAGEIDARGATAALLARPLKDEMEEL